MNSARVRTNAVPIVNISQLEKLIEVAVLANHPILVTGAPGIGKTAAPINAFTRREWPFMLMHPVVDDPTDSKGMPAVINNPDTGEAEAVFLPFSNLKVMMDYPHDAEKPLCVFIDDLGQAAPMVQAALMQLLLQREINGKKISPMVRFIAATNRKEDKAAVKGILEPVKSRFATIVELQPTLDEFIGYALSHKLYPTIAPFIRFRPSALHDFKPSAGMEQSPCPRTWEKLSDMLSTFDQVGIDDPNLRAAIIQGAVGEGVTGEFMAFERVHADMPDLDYLLEHPETFEQPTKLNVSYAIAGGLAQRCTVRNIGRILRIAARMQKEFAAAMVNDCLHVCPEIESNDNFTDWAIENSDIFL